MRDLTRQSTGLATALGLGLLALTTLPAMPAQVSAQSVHATGTLVVEGGSTLRSWDCGTDDLRFEIRASESGFSMDALGDAVGSLVLRVPTAALECGNDRKNSHMWEAMGTEDHPWIIFRMERYTAEHGGQGVELVLSGTLEMLSEVRDVEISLTALVTDEEVRVKGTHVLDMTEWGVQPPRQMLGTLRVRDEVEVHIEVTLRPEG